MTYDTRNPGARTRSLLLATALVTSAASESQADARTAERSAQQELAKIADEAYLYGYAPLLLEQTMRVNVNVPVPSGERAPINQFARVTQLPDAKFTNVVMPNVDTLYTSAFLDLKREPIVLRVPDSEGRYYLMPMLSAYTDVFAAPGKRTNGTAGFEVAIVGPGFKGDLPEELTKIDAPTDRVWLIGRTQIDGKADLPNVVELTDRYTLTPLSAYGRAPAPPRNDHIDSSIDMKTPPPDQLAKLSDRAYFERLAKLLEDYPPPAQDRAALQRFEQIGLVPGKFTPSSAANKAVHGAGKRALTLMRNHAQELGREQAGWKIDTQAGSYGTRYLDRATVAYVGLGANLPQDAVYPATQTDSKGKPLDGRHHKYVLHFPAGQEPPAQAFWSLTLYNSAGYLVGNPSDRYAIGSRDKLKRNADGSLDVAVQHNKPEGELASNWLPAPAGRFKLLLRVYWPKESLLKGRWQPPAVQRVEQ